VNLWDRFVLPRLIGLACGSKPIARQRAKIIPRARGLVVEFGFGSGTNLPFYDTGAVSRIIAVEPSPEMLAVGRRERRTDIPVEEIIAGAEATGLPDAVADTVVIAYALCTIPNPAAALAEARRILKPDGRLLFVEHGLAPDPDVARTQRLIEPVWRRIAGGCRLCRDPVALIGDAGFVCEAVETMYLPRTPRFAGYNSWGSARQP
jgi:ubiquinone/menaquinone biosynthesis C-methylase UbiE